MKDTVRTTLVLPRELLRRAKVEGALRDQTLSQLVADILEKTLSDVDEENVDLPIGKYDFGGVKPPTRAEIYDEALRSELPR